MMTRESLTTIDVDLQVRVQIALDVWANSSHMRARERVIALANQNGEITLRGQVYGRDHFEQVTQVARKIPGVKLVFNQIAVTRDH